MDDTRRLAFEYVAALNVNNPYRAAVTKAQAESLGIWGSVYLESLKLRAHGGDILASRELRAIIDDLPREIWLDTNCGHVSTKEPDSYEECYECNGSGEAPHDIDDGDDIDACEYCNGEGSIEVDFSDWYYLDTRELVELLFGRTIAREFS